MIRVDISAKYGNKCNGIGIENCSWFTVHPAVCWAVRLFTYKGMCLIRVTCTTVTVSINVCYNTGMVDLMAT